MISYKMIVGCLLILSIFSIDYASALKVEKIVGGSTALQSDFKYQISIVGKYNLSKIHNLLCAGGIIKNHYIITSARCFMYTYNRLKKFTFFAVVGADILISKSITLKEFDKIYVYYYSHYHSLALARLKESLDLEHRTDLAALELPSPQETFHGYTGVVAGFGMHSMNDITRKQSRELIRINSKHSLLLKYANVLIINRSFNETEDQAHMNESICGMLVRDFTDVCGLIPPNEMYEHRGLCVGDNGAPLVVGNKLVGIAGKHRKDCDDTTYGVIYHRVAKYRHFIQSVVEGKPMRGVRIYDNPEYVSNQNDVSSTSSN